MSNDYKRDAAANRDTLFGPSSSSKSGPSRGPKHKRDAAANRDALFGSSSGSGKPKSSKSNNKSRAATSSRSSSNRSNSSNSNYDNDTSGSGRRTISRPIDTTMTSSATTSKGYKYSSSSTDPSSISSSSSKTASVLSGPAKARKLEEAEEYRERAKKAMARGVFSRPDPLAAGMYYKRAADAYQQCGEWKLEQLHRIASGDSQMGQGAYATAAAEYTRAAQLAQLVQQETTVERKRQEGYKLHSDAANAYRQMGEMGKAADSTVQAALALLWEDTSTLMDKSTLTAMEEAVEAHVPDVLNRYGRYRQTGISAFVDPEKASSSSSSLDPNKSISADTMALAREMMVTKAYAHEPLQKLVSVFCRYGEFASGLYAAGAASAILESGSIATLTLSRSYVVETILLLAMGDPVAARQYFLEVHVQKDFYLTSRECKLAEDLFSAVLARDADALEEARSPTGSNRAALSNLDESLRTVVTQLRVSGVARRKVKSTTAKPTKRTAVDDELDQELMAQPPSSTTTTRNAAAIAPRPPPTTTTGRKQAATTEKDEDSESEEEEEDEETHRALKSDALQAELDALGLESDEVDEDDDDSDVDLR